MSYIKDINLPTLIDKLSDSNNIKISNNSKGDRVGTVIDKIVEKADNVTKAINQEIVNDSYSFKVGTGREINVSQDVQDGFSEIALKGVTYQNIAYNAKHIKIQKDNNLNTEYRECSVFNTRLLKQNTTYTLFIDIIQNTCTMRMGLAIRGTDFMNTGEAKYIDIASPGKTGSISISFTTPNYNVFDQVFLFMENADYMANKILEFKNVILLKGDHTNNVSLSSYFEGIQGVGDKSKNLFNYKNVIIPVGGSNCDRFKDGFKVLKKDNIHYREENITVKPHTTYIASFKSNIPNQGRIRIRNAATGNIIYQNNSVGVPLKFTTSDITKIHMELFHAIESNELPSYYDIQLEEGVQTDFVPYEKHKIEILSNGKNLFNVKNVKIYKGYYFNAASNGVVMLNSTTTSILTKNIPNKRLLVSKKSSPRFCIAFTNSDTLTSSLPINGLINGEQETSLMVENSGNYKNMMIYIDNTSMSDEEIQSIVNSIQIEESSTPTLYKPYQEHKTQILLNEPLMRLSDSVYDEITSDGKLIRRIGKKVLSGIEDWKFNEIWSSGDIWCQYYKLLDKKNGIYNIISNSFKTEYPRFLDRTVLNSGIHGEGNTNAIYINIEKTKLENQTTESFKKYLANNPVTIYYELETPIITPIDNEIVLPNGVCDQVNNDKTIRKISEKFIDHNLQINDSNNIVLNNTYRFGVFIDDIKRDLSSPVMCSDFKYVSEGYQQANDEESICRNLGNIYIRVLKTKLETQDIAGIKKWLKNNPITVYYELAEPVTTTAYIPDVRIFENGHITFNTLIAPESTHVVQLNKSAQIETNIREVQRLESKVDYLESFYDGMLLETNHKLANLSFNFSLMKKGES